MKKLLIISVLLVLGVASYAQENVTKFLGIPVDGTKAAMIQKLKAKGFTYNSTYDYLEGEFNGVDVELFVVTNNNKVYRIAVVDAYPSSEGDIKRRFNKLCGQFERNPKYIPFSGSQSIPDDDDVSYEMTVNSKRYEAVYYQADTAFVNAKVREYVKSLEQKYTVAQEELESIASTKQMIEKAISSLNSPVWFMIDEQYGKYRILMYYDNEHNRSDGEDL